MNTMPYPDDLRVLLLEADGNLFRSEAPAFDAFADVTNRFLAALGIEATSTPEHLLATTTGKNFRTTAVDLAAAHRVAVESALGSSDGTGGPTLTSAMLDDWVEGRHRVEGELSDHRGGGAAGGASDDNKADGRLSVVQCGLASRPTSDLAAAVVPMLRAHRRCCRRSPHTNGQSGSTASGVAATT